MATETNTGSSQNLKCSCDQYTVYFVGYHYQLSLWNVVKMHYKTYNQLWGWAISNLTSHLGGSPPRPPPKSCTVGNWFRLCVVLLCTCHKIFLNGLQLFFFKPFSNIHITILPFDTSNLSSCESILSNPRVNTRPRLPHAERLWIPTTHLRSGQRNPTALPPWTWRVKWLDFLWGNIIANKVWYCQLNTAYCCCSLQSDMTLYRPVYWMDITSAITTASTLPHQT